MPWLTLGGGGGDLAAYFLTGFEKGEGSDEAGGGLYERGGYWSLDLSIFSH